MTRTQPFPRGFLITRADSSAAPPEGWGAFELPGADWVFHHDSSASPELRFTPDGSQWVLTHGMCLVADPDSTSSEAAQYVVDRLAVSQTQFLDALDLLGGRHIVLRGGPEGITLHPDAMGTRSVYFSAEAEAAASHLNLLASVLPFRERLPSEGRDTAGLLWSRTPLHGTDALLPNHSLELGTWSVERFFPRAENRYTGLTLEQKISCFRSIWDRQLQELEATGSELVFSLTGGADSRTVLALSWPSRSRFHAFTYTLREDRAGTPWERSLTKDRQIVDQLLSAMPELRHSYIYADVEERTEIPASLARTIALNTTGFHGHWLIPHYIKNFGDLDAVHMRGSGFEVGRAYWGVSAVNDTDEALRRLAYGRLSKGPSAEPLEARDQYFAEGVRRWGYDQDLRGFHRLDLYYWEIRMGRWAAEIHNETDVAFDSWVGMNVRALAEISLSMPLQDRKSGRLYAELINDSQPLLNFFGKNDVRNLYEQTRDSIRTLSSTESTLELLGGLHADSPSGSEVLVTADPSLLRIPIARFAPGERLSRLFTPVPHGGDLRFTLTSEYGRPQAAGNFRYQIWINDRLEVSWDGAISKAPVHVTVADLRAGDRVALSAVPLLDRRAAPPWESASRTWIQDAVLERRRPSAPRRVAVDTPLAVWADWSAQPPVLHPQDLSVLPPELLPLDEPTRLDVDLGPCRVPLLVVRREAPGLITLFNGAVDLERSHGEPVFQRSSWSADLPQSQIFVADPGTVGPDALSLSWGQISAGFSAVPGTLEALRLLAAALGAQDPAERTYFGSSAGGFWAWSAAILDPGSRAVVNNAQIDWTRWMAPAVNALRTSRFGGQSPLALRTRHPQRTSVLKLWKKSGQPAIVDYWVNTASSHDARVDLPQVEAFQAAEPELTAHLSIHRYADPELGHNPLRREDTLRLLTQDPVQD